MKVFIVGIAGGVGSRLARLLSAAGDRVDGLHLANVATGRLDLTTAPMISAWGRAPVA